MRPFSTSVVLPAGLPISGKILTSDVRSIDTLAQSIRYAGAPLDQTVAQAVRAKLERFIAN